jgi:hypothetical protein
MPACAGMLNMAAKPVPTPPRGALVLQANCVDKTAERIGTITGVVGAMAAGKETKPE